MFSSNTTQVEGGYQISRSLRFNSADSAYLTRTPASAGNQKTYTISVWCKRAKLDTSGAILSARASIPWTFLGFSNGDGVAGDQCLQFSVTAGTSPGVYTSAALRDVSAWYHIICAVDTTQATASNRVKIYINSVLQTLISGNYPTLNQNTDVNSTIAHEIGNTSSYSNIANFYLTEYNFIDGQQLTPSSFGETNAQTGVWQPKAYSGSYGTNGFYLNFSDNSNTTAATLGKDYSGNGNNWTPNNFSVTAGAGNDSLVDSPTSYGTDTGVGGTVRGNYATLNPISLAGGTFTNGNLDWAAPTTDGRFCLATIPVNFMNCYCEVTIGSATSFQQVGVYGNPTTFNPRVQYRSDGQAQIDGVVQATYASYTTNDIIGMSYNSSTGSVSFYKNGTLQGSMTVTSTSVTQYFAAGSNSSGATANYTFNFGQRPFAYTAPSGFLALCTQNLPTPTIGATTATQAGKYFNPVLYTGTGSSLGVTGVGFQPDWVWIKSRSAATSNSLYDAVRGVQKELVSNNAGDQVTETTSLTAFGSDGFTVGALARLNTSAATYVAWNWKANGAGSTNTAGSITATVSASAASGFSVVTYTGTGVGATVGHGLGVAPQLIFVKGRDTSTADWFVYTSTQAATKFLILNTTAAVGTDTTAWNSTAPTSTVFSVGGAYSTSFATKTYVAYCFAPIAGYSAFGSYTGNGSADGPFVFTGFRPAYVMAKRTDTTDQWTIYDSARNTSNLTTRILYANLSNAEDVGTDGIDMLSNGIKMRNTYSNLNASGGTYIYMAFASNPFKYSLAR
jgi:hypothetical protein